jgi:preprotein translocase subunit YajC
VPFSSLASALVAAGSSGSTKSSGGGLTGFLPLLLIVLVGYLLLVRPARNRQRKAMATRGSVEPGVEVTTTGGLIATVVSVDDNTVTLEIAPGVHSKFVKAAVGRVNTPAEPLDGTHEQIEPEAVEETPPSDQVSLDKPDSDPTDR